MPITFAHEAGQNLLFTSTDSDGPPPQRVEIVRFCTYGVPDAEGSTAHYEADYEAGPMYVIRLADGTEQHAFEDELTDHQPKGE